MATPTAFEQLREANPVPEPSALRERHVDLEPLVLAADHGYETGEDATRAPAPARRRPRFGWVVAAATMAAAALIGLVMVWAPVDEPDVANTAPAPSPPSPESMAPETYTIEAYDFGFNGVPDRVAVGSSLELFNSSDSEFHNLVVLKLGPDDPRTLEDFAALSPSSRILSDLDCYRASAFGVSGPGCDSEATTLSVEAWVGGIHALPGQAALDGGARIRLDAPGRYLILDMTPEGADVVDAEYYAVNDYASAIDVPGGLFGYQHGMIAFIEVVEPVQSPAPTAANYTIEAYDFGFNGVPAEVGVGSSLTLSNLSGEQFHDLIVIQLFDDDGRTIEDFIAEPPSTYWSDDWCPEADPGLCEGQPLPGFQVPPANFQARGYEPYVGLLSASPGETDDLRIVLNTTGRFLIMDMVPQGADPDAATAALAGLDWPVVPGDGPLGYQQGMIAFIEVVE